MKIGTLHAPESIFAAAPDAFPAFRPASPVPITHTSMPFQCTSLHSCTKRLHTLVPVLSLFAITWATRDEHVVLSY